MDFLFYTINVCKFYKLQIKYRKITARITQRLVASERVPLSGVSNHYSEASSYKGIPWRSSIFSTFAAVHLCEFGSVDVNKTCLFPPFISYHLKNIFVEMTALVLNVFDDVDFTTE
jgi:hypothetical protein